MKKKVFIILGIIVTLLVVLAFVITVGYTILQDLRQESKLKAEVEEIWDLSNTEEFNQEKIREKLNNIVTTGDYAVVEKAYKQYLSDQLNNMIEIALLLNDENITNCLTVENYKTDGPKFKKTKQYISNTVQQLEESKIKYEEFFTKDKAMSYLEQENLDSYYIEFYQEQLIAKVEEQQAVNSIKDSINEVISLLKSCEKVIDFLVENSDNWKIQEENITFTTTKLSEEYNKLLDSLLEETTSEENIIYEKNFGTYSLPQNWIESKEHSTSTKFFYVVNGEEQSKRPNNISVNAGTNKYTKQEHEKFKTAILNQLMMQIGNEEGVTLNANGFTTEKGDIVYTFVIKEEQENIATTQYYIVGDYQYILIHETVYGISEEADIVAKNIVNSFQWKEN